MNCGVGWQPTGVCGYCEAFSLILYILSWMYCLLALGFLWKRWSINHFLHDLWVEDLQDLHAMMNMKYIISIQVARIVFLAAWSIHLIHIPSSYQPPDIYPNLPKSQSLDNSESWASVYVLIKKGVFYWFHPDSMELVPPNRLKSS